MLTGTDIGKYWDDCGTWVGSHGKKLFWTRTDEHYTCFFCRHDAG